MDIAGLSHASTKWRRPALHCAVALHLALVFPAHASDINVPTGCETPRAIPGAHTYYINPAKGSPDGDGSQSSPWRTLAETLAPSRHLVTGGDTLVLSDGDHGDVRIVGRTNDFFISVIAAPGQHPLIRSMRIFDSARWIFRGLKFQSEPPAEQAGGDLVMVAAKGKPDASSNFIFIDNSFSSRDDVSNWNNEDWINKSYVYGFESRIRCTTVAHNHFLHLRNGIAIGGDFSTVDDNRFESMGNDAINFHASYLTFRHNYIGDSRHTPAEPNHPDAIQGWSLPGATNRNVTIDGNLITNLNLSDDNYMQGISIFGGLWDGIVVSNNVVVSNHWHGIALWGVRHGLIVNNTLASIKPRTRPSWISVRGTVDNPHDVSVIIRNNIAPQIVVDAPSAVVDHNLTELGVRSERDPLGRNRGDTTNLVDPNLLLSFKKFDPSSGQVDVRPRPDSRAIGAGSADQAPDVDIEGQRRKPPITLGAYAHP